MPDLRTADSVYLRKPYGATSSYPYIEKSGHASNEERLVSAALAANLVPEEELRAIRPPLPQIQLFPPRFGLDHPPLTMRDIMAVGRRYPDSANQRSGGAGGYAGGTSTPANNWW